MVSVPHSPHSNITPWSLKYKRLETFYRTSFCGGRGSNQQLRQDALHLEVLLTSLPIDGDPQHHSVQPSAEGHGELPARNNAQAA